MSGSKESDFTTLVLGLASQAMLHLGAMPNPDTNAPEVSLPLAQHTIDLIAMLQTKTEGNLTPEEASVVQRMLYDLRLRYVKVCKSQGGTSCE